MLCWNKHEIINVQIADLYLIVRVPLNLPHVCPALHRDVWYIIHRMSNIKICRNSKTSNSHLFYLADLFTIAGRLFVLSWSKWHEELSFPVALPKNIACPSSAQPKSNCKILGQIEMHNSSTQLYHDLSLLKRLWRNNNSWAKNLSQSLHKINQRRKKANQIVM